MPKADLVLPDGTKVTIDGTTEEVARLLATYSSPPKPGSAAAPHSPKSKAGDTKKTSRKGPTAFIIELRDEGYFKTKRTLASIQAALEQRGHIYAKKTISQLLIQLTRRRELRRIKENKIWEYVQ
jgi:hypothetical protein